MFVLVLNLTELGILDDNTDGLSMDSEHSDKEEVTGP